MKTFLSDYKFDILVITAVFILTSFAGYWNIPVERTQEARIAVTAREALEDGNWLIPTLNGAPRLKKPPLMTWIVALSYKCFGKINEFSARFPSVLFAYIAALGLFFLGIRLFGRLEARVSSLVMITAFQFIKHSRLAEIDMALLLCVLFTKMFWYLALSSRERKRLFYILGYIAGAVAVNLKGPAGFVIPFVSFLTLLLLMKRFDEFKKWLNPAGILLCIVLSSSWYLLAVFHEKRIASAVFRDELEIAFIKGIDHPGPFYYYLYTLFICFAPWTVFMYAAAFFALVKKEKNREMLFVLVWFFVSLVLLSLTPNKQPHYALLGFPPMALITGWFAGDIAKRKSAKKYLMIITCVLVSAVTAGALADSFFLHKKIYPDSSFKGFADKIKEDKIDIRDIYTYKFMNAELIFYLGGPLPVIKPDELSRILKDRGNMYIITRAEDAPDLPQGRELIRYRYDGRIYVLLSI
ncbi:glycosyltransferase family 39 protein [bacterium]|nr:glycosyltransferase family 39 protein [bacterium]